jgi:hypothetical protein
VQTQETAQGIKILSNIKIKIDQDFARGETSILFWKTLLINHIITKTKQKPISRIEMGNGIQHPFSYKAKSVKDGIIKIDDLIMNDCNFVESHENFEVQIADIIAIITNRFHNRNCAFSAYKKLKATIKKASLTEIVLNHNPDETIIEPEIIK